MITRDATKLKVGQVYYTPWCDEHGKVIDDGTVHRVGEQELRWTAADPQFRWLSQNAAGLDVAIEDVTEQVAALALQGPFSRAVLEAATGEDFGDLRYFRRRGGEAGRDRRSTSAAPATRATSATSCGSRRARGGGVGRDLRGRRRVRDPARRDARARRHPPRGRADPARGRLHLGPPRHEPRPALQPVRDRARAPRSFDKADYVGRRALKAEQAAGGPPRRLVGLILDWYDIERLYDEQGLPPAISPTTDRSPVPVFAEAGRQVGKATSHGWSPILKQAIALASVGPSSSASGPGCRSSGRSRASAAG